MNKAYFGSLFIAGLLALCGSALAVTIDTQPANPVSINEGSTLNLSVVATPTPPATGVLYQWYYSDTNSDKLINGATSATLTIPNVNGTHAGIYYVVVQDAGTGGTPLKSDNSNVTVHLRPKLKTGPKSAKKTQTENVTFEVVYTGSTLNESFQWQKYDATTKMWDDILGATSQSYTIDPIAPEDAGKYRVVVNNVTNLPLTSPAATLTVNTVAIITQQPTVPTALRVIATGASTALKVVATGQGPLKYQWQFDSGGGFEDISTKGTGSSFTIKGIEDNEGKYRVIVRNALNDTLSLPPAVSSEVDVEVDDKPSIDTAGQPVGGTFEAGDDPVDLTVTPSGSPPFTYQWQKDGKNIGGPARFNQPTDVVADGVGGLLVVDSRNHAIRSIDADGTVGTLAGELGVSGDTDDAGPAARFNLPYGIAADGSGGYYVTDSGSHTIRYVTGAGVVSTFAGTVGVSGVEDETGILASFNGPTGIALDSDGNIYVADTQNHTIRKITSLGVVTTFAGTAGVIGSQDGNGADAAFFLPMGLAVDADDNLYVADSGNHAIRKIAPNGDVTTFSGLPGTAGKVDGSLFAARYNTPVGIEVASTGDILVVERFNHAVRAIRGLAVLTVAGKLSLAGSVDGAPNSARFNGPVGIAETGAGEVSVVEIVNHTVRKFSQTSGAIGTVAGNFLTAGARDGAGLANEATLELGPIHWTDRGTYKCIVRNRVGMVSSKTAKVVVNSPPVFLVQPADTTGSVGGSATFSVVVGGNTPISYQWFFIAPGDTVNEATEVAKAKGSKLSLKKLEVDTHQGTYFCRAFGKFPNANTFVDSELATLQIQEAPKASIALTANSNVKGIFGKVPVAGSFTLTATATAGGGVLRYQWLLKGKNFGSESTSNVLTVDPALLSHSGAWNVVVKNDAASHKSNSINIQVQTPPVITGEPQPVGAVVEDNVVFQVTATGSAPLKYQWYLNGTSMPGKTAAILTLTNVGLSMTNNVYSCVVSNAVGDATSADALLTVGPAPVPDFVDHYPRQARVGEKVRIVGTGLAYTKTVAFGNLTASFVVEPDGSILATVPKLNTIPTGGPGSLTGGPPVNIVVTTRGGNSAGVSMPFIPYDPTIYSNDFRRHPTILTGKSVNFTGDNNFFTGGDGGSFFPSGFGDGSTAWFVWTPAESGSYTVYAESLSGQDISVAVYDLPYQNTADEPTQWPIGYGDDYFGQGFFDVTRSVVEVNLVAGRQYTFFIGGYFTFSAGSYQLQIFKGPPSLIGLSAGFTPSEGFSAGASVMGQDRWTGQGDAEAAQVVSMQEGADSQVVLGGVPSDEGVVVWPELTPEERAGKSFLGVNVTFDSPSGATSDQFNWTLYDQNMEPVGAVWFNNADGSIYATTGDGTVTPSAENFINGGTYRFEMTWDSESGIWNAAIDGVALFGGLDFPAGMTFGGISAGWVPGSGSEAPASMSFDGVLLPDDQ